MGRDGVMGKLRIMDGVTAEGEELQPAVGQPGEEKDPLWQRGWTLAQKRGGEGGVPGGCLIL